METPSFPGRVKSERECCVISSAPSRCPLVVEVSMKLITAFELDILHCVKGPLVRRTEIAVLGALAAPLARLDPGSWLEGLEVRDGHRLSKEHAAPARMRGNNEQAQLSKFSFPSLRRCAETAPILGHTTVVQVKLNRFEKCLQWSIQEEVVFQGVCSLQEKKHSKRSLCGLLRFSRCRRRGR